MRTLSRFIGLILSDEHMENLTIKSWAEDDRPREKLLEKGRHVLTEAELIGILIGSGNQEETAVGLAQRILASINNDLAELGKLNVSDLMRFKGIGQAKAVSILAALELGRRRRPVATGERTKLTSSQDAFQLIQSTFLDLPHEEFWMILLNRSNQLIRKECVSKGGVSGTVVDPKMVFKPALQYLACSMIICHNHPSGNLNPSASDIKITKQLKEAGRTLEIPVLDHLIVAEEKYYSFADNGLM
jgi:DNA repair protein RadC